MRQRRRLPRIQHSTKMRNNSANMEKEQEENLGQNLGPIRSNHARAPRRPVARGPNALLPPAAVSFISLCIIIIVVIAARSPRANAYSEGNYDPEQQDGIPVFSARSVPRSRASSSASSLNDDDWPNGSDGDLMSAAPNKPLLVQRRQSDGDLDEGLEDEEEDEYKSGSSPHESIESPGYGESRRFARDGDEIEEFFDRHLGPPREAAVSAESSPEASRAQLVPVGDPDDLYEAAASSPLSSIFHSLLGHHDHKHTKRPFLQIATSSSASETSEEAAAPSKAASASRGLKASQSAQSFTEAAPIALTLTPIAAPSTITVQEQPDSQEGASQDQEAAGQTGSGVREIYIGRRPTVMNYVRQAQLVQQQQQQMLQQPAPLPGYYTAGSANVWRGPNGRPMMYEHEQSIEHARHPVAASYAYQRGQPAGASSAASPVADDEQTVTYGLSFGGSDSKDASADLEADHANDESGAAGGESPDAQQDYATPYSTRYTTSSTRAHNNYYANNYGSAPSDYVRAYQSGQHQPHYHPQHVMMIPQQQQQQPAQGYHPSYQQQYASGATRYHRDPSESPNHLAAMRAAHIGISYAGAGQHRGVGYPREATSSAAYVQQRQRLLASLDREIKASPQYRQNTAAAATASKNLYARRPLGRNPNRQHMVAFRAVRRGQPGDDLDAFNSFHSEVDPYKTFTKTSRMISGADPLTLLANTRQAVVPSESRSQIQPDSRSAQGNSEHIEGREVPIGPNGKGDKAEPAGPYEGQQVANSNLLTGPLTNYDSRSTSGDLLRTKNQSTTGAETVKDGQRGGSPATTSSQSLSRVRRDDSEDREIDDDADDDGVWVDDDGDDDNKQQSSDVNETSQEPEEEEEEDGQQDAANNRPAQQMNPPGVIGAPHSYELSPNDLMIYHG